MKRKRFLGVLALSTLAASSGLPMATPATPLGRWIRDHGVTAAGGGPRGLQLRAAIARERLGATLQDLASICERLHAEGNRLKGVSHGEAFELVVS